MKQVNTREYIRINNKEQYIAILSENVDNPILLYLHGGPGDAALPLVMKYNSDLSRNYTFVIWEQRGTGKSFFPFSTNENIRIQDFIDDMKELIQTLLLRFSKEKVYILGHSWGSILGLTFTQKYPELVETYIGCGQVTNMKKMVNHWKEFSVNLETNEKVKKRLLEVDTSFNSEKWLSDLSFLVGRVVKNGGSLFGKTSYLTLIKDFLFSKEYNVKDIIHRIKGSDQSIQFLWKEAMTINFEPVKSFQTPIIFIHGDYDHHCHFELLKEYYESIESDKKLYFISNSSHFPQWCQSQQFNEIVNGLRLQGE